MKSDSKIGYNFQVFFEAIMRTTTLVQLNIRPTAILKLQCNGFEDRVIKKIVRK